MISALAERRPRTVSPARVRVFDQLPVAGIPVSSSLRVGEAGRLLGNGEQFVGIQGNQAVGITDGVAEQIESAHPRDGRDRLRSPRLLGREPWQHTYVVTAKLAHRC